MERRKTSAAIGVVQSSRCFILCPNDEFRMYALAGLAKVRKIFEFSTFQPPKESNFHDQR